MPVKYVLVAVLASALTIFALQNGTPTRVRFLFWDVDGVSLATIILLSAAIGVVLVGPALWWDRWRLRGRIRALEARRPAPTEPGPTAEAPGQERGHGPGTKP